MNKNAILLTLLLVLGAFSCSKSKKYAGDYFCKVDGNYYSLNSYSFDTTYYEQLEVIREKKSIIVLGRSIHGDSLKKGEWFTYSGYPNVFKIKVVSDSMYISTWSGGQGGGGSSLYFCLKE